MYAKYTTDAIVLSTGERGEADSFVALYTYDFGLVFARAAGARKESSRMRYALYAGSHMSASLVRGKAGWRLAGARAIGAYLAPEDVQVFARVARLARRLMSGDEQNEYIFRSLESFLNSLADSSLDRAALELIAVTRLLHGLGYISKEALAAAPILTTAGEVTAADLELAAKEKRALLGAVNGALAASQL